MMRVTHTPYTSYTYSKANREEETAKETRCGKNTYARFNFFFLLFPYSVLVSFHCLSVCFCFIWFNWKFVGAVVIVGGNIDATVSCLYVSFRYIEQMYFRLRCDSVEYQPLPRVDVQFFEFSSVCTLFRF